MKLKPLPSMDIYSPIFNLMSAGACVCVLLYSWGVCMCAILQENFLPPPPPIPPMPILCSIRYSGEQRAKIGLVCDDKTPIKIVQDFAYMKYRLHQNTHIDT